MYEFRVSADEDARLVCLCYRRDLQTQREVMNCEVFYPYVSSDSDIACSDRWGTGLFKSEELLGSILKSRSRDGKKGFGPGTTRLLDSFFFSSKVLDGPMIAN